MMEGGDEEITAEEIRTSIARLKSQKAPGVWGVTSEMLKAGGKVAGGCIALSMWRGRQD